MAPVVPCDVRGGQQTSVSCILDNLVRIGI
jgi:hypothetical protein